MNSFAGPDRSRWRTTRHMIEHMITNNPLQVLCKKLSDLADFVFIDAPFELPLEDGQEVPMRTWWRRWEDARDVDEALGVVQVWPRLSVLPRFARSYLCVRSRS